MNLFPALTYDGRFRMKGKLKGNYYKVQGDISSQFISGLLFVLPLLPHDSVIDVVGPFESKPYVNLTVDMLRKFGIVVQHQGKRFYVKGNQQYKPHNYEVEVDYSALAFYEVANALGSEITYLNNITYSLQGDKKITEIIQRKQSLIDVSDCPDLVPALTVLASFMEGRTEIINASRVRLKESDRLMAITEVLNALGGRVVERADSLVVKQIDRFKGARVSAFNDHRIAMALAIAATRCDGPMEFDNLEVVNKSYKEFWNDFIKLGGKVYE
jgi:3-phosphoshikimate 1-carboxyvinyltransferase